MRLRKSAKAAAIATLAMASATYGAAVPPATAATNHDIHLTIWDQAQSSKNIAAGYKRIFAGFEKANPGVTVSISTFPYSEYEAKLLTALKGGTGPDVFTSDEVWTSEFAAAGVAQPLTAYLRNSTIKSSNFFGPAWATDVYQGQVWGVPLNFDVWEQMYYNVDMLKKAGIAAPPQTWPQLLADAKKLSNPPKQFAVDLLGNEAESTSTLVDSFIYSNGGTVIGPDGKAALASAPDEQALSFYKELAAYAPKGVVNSSEADQDADFVAGKVAIIFDGDWEQDTFNSEAHFNWGVAAPPAPPGKKFVGDLGGWNLILNKKSPYKAEAFKLIEYISQPANEEAVNSLVPALKSAGSAFVKEYRKDPSLIISMLGTSKPRPISPSYPDESTQEQLMVEKILEGTSVTKAAASADSQINSIIASS